MRLNVSNNILLGALFALAAISVGLKAAVGPPDDGKGAPGAKVDAELAKVLQSQGFTTVLSPRRFQSAVTYAARGNCRLSVRDARDGVEVASVFARDASDIGPVRYLYRGQVSKTPPTAAEWFDRFGNKVVDRLGIQRRTPVPIALATSPGCQGQDFKLRDFRAS